VGRISAGVEWKLFPLWSRGPIAGTDPRCSTVLRFLVRKHLLLLVVVPKAVFTRTGCPGVVLSSPTREEAPRTANPSESPR